MPKKYYAVANGRTKGVFGTWDECKAQVYGYKGAKYKSFKTLKEAQNFVKPSHPTSTSTANSQKATSSKYFGKNAATSVASLAEKNESNADQRSSKRKRTQQQALGQQHVENPCKKVKSASNDNNKISIHVMFDGGARGNPGIAGAGAYLTIIGGTGDIARKTVHIRDFVGHTSTNNQAEYQGLIDGLLVARDELNRLLEMIQEQQQQPSVELFVQGDSKLIIQQCRGEFQVKSAKLKPLFQWAKRLLADIANTRQVAKCNIVLEHVYRSDNKVADGLANAAMDAQRSWLTTSDDSHETEHAFDSYSEHVARRV